MIINNIDDILRNNMSLKDVEYLFYLKNEYELEKLYKFSEEVHRKNFEKMEYESNIYYPTVYQIENNCPTCGYRTSESKRKYTEDFIIKTIEYKLEDIKQYPITGINCYNKDISGIRELLLILRTLEKYKDLKINVRVSDLEHIKHLTKFNLNSIIFQSSKNKLPLFNKKNDENFAMIEKESIKYIKENTNFKVTYEFLINYGETYKDIIGKINEIQKYDADYIEIVGYDPFLDCPEEYNPQYSKEYILKIISLLRILFPEKEIKIQYATNNNNFLENYKIGINCITGIYTKNLNRNLENTHIIKKNNVKTKKILEKKRKDIIS